MVETWLQKSEWLASRTRSGMRPETTEVGDLLSFEQLELAQGEVIPVVPGSAEVICFCKCEEAMIGNVTNIDVTDVGMRPADLEVGMRPTEGDNDDIVLCYI